MIIVIPFFLPADQNKSSGGNSGGAKGIGPKKIEINLSKVKLAASTTADNTTNKSESVTSKADQPENQKEEEDVIVLADEVSNEGKPDNDISNGKQ